MSRYTVQHGLLHQLLFHVESALLRLSDVIRRRRHALEEREAHAWGGPAWLPSSPGIHHETGQTCPWSLRDDIPF